MPSYICLTYVKENHIEATRLADTLAAYGFRIRTLHESSEPSVRAKTLNGATLVLALTSQAAHRAESVSADLRRLSDKSRPPICVSLEENPIDARFCNNDTFDLKHRAERIPYPAAETPDMRTVGLFIHRLFICRLAKISDAFSPSRCRRDNFGRAIALAVAAYGGDRDAAYALGCAYERGDALPVLEDEAAAWIRRAADAGSVDARLHLGELSLTGWGVEPDEVRAFSLFSSVADEGDVRGEYRLALCYLNGAGVVPDPTRAVYHLRRAARWNYAPALYRLGLLLRDGVGTSPDARMALQCLYHACRKGVADSTHKDASLYMPPVWHRPTVSFALDGDEDDDFDSDIFSHHMITLSDIVTDADADLLRNAEPASVSLPMPPTLYGPRTGRRAAAVTMRHMYHHIAANRAFRASVRGAIPFSFSRYAATYRPESAWIGGLTRSAHITVPGGGEASGHPILHMNSTALAMGVPFEPSDAALALADLLESGDAASGLRPRHTRALVWYRYALRQGNTEALLRLADAYRHGHGAPADPAFAAVLYRIAADWGDPRGQFALAVAYERGIGVPVDMAEAIHRYEQAAMAGYAPAQNNLGGCYEHGVGVARNMLTAVEWYLRAADAGLPEALCRLGLCYETGRGVPSDPARAVDLYRKAADAKHPYALYRLGICYDRREQYTDAVRLFQSAADAGLPEASYALAMCHAAGHGTRRDLDRAVSLLQDAAAGDYLPAVYRLSMCCLDGVGIPRNTALAITHLRRAVRLWHTRKNLYLSDTAPAPLCAYTPLESAGDALYMLALCTLEGWDKNHVLATEADRARAAYPLFSESADIGHVGALVALGDLYAHGLMADKESTDEKAVANRYYARAVRVSAARRGTVSPIAEDSSVTEQMAGLPLPRISASDMRGNGLLSNGADALSVNASPALIALADKAVNHGRELADEGADIPASEVFDTAWRLYAAAVELGSVDARVGMAKCVYLGYSRQPDARAALRLLQTAENHAAQQVLSSLCLGDLWRVGACGAPNIEQADAAYACGLTAPLTDSEVGPYALSIRRKERQAHDRQVRTELLYRLATLRAVYPSNDASASDPPPSSAFSLLCEAVLSGHQTAREDLARMYAYERRYSVATAPAEKPTAKQKRPRRRGRRVTEHTVLRDHAVWLSDYYTALWPQPVPFTRDMPSMASDHIPAHITVSVTPLMLADALNYLGDCLFYGNGLARRPAAAAACYREVVNMDLFVPRGEPMPACAVWAQYNLGWCLLRGEGVSKNEREGVRYLTLAARSHPEACYALGECYEHGVGVDAADLREAVKFYRRAWKLGYGKAARQLKKLERLLERISPDL